MNEEALRALKSILMRFHEETMFSRQKLTALEMFLKKHKDQSLWSEYQSSLSQVDKRYQESMIDRDPSKLELLVPRSSEDVPLWIAILVHTINIR